MAEQDSVRYRLNELAKSMLPDSDRLQVLICLTAELAEMKTNVEEPYPDGRKAEILRRITETQPKESET